MTEWQKVKLGEVCQFTTGKLNSNAAEENGLYPFFTCSPDIFKINTYAFECEAILLAGNNANGDFNIKLYNGKFNAYQRTYVITTSENIIIQYLFYALKTSLEIFKQVSQGTATKFLTVKILNSFEIPLPPLDEQKRIAKILSSLDEKIENNNAINKNLEEQAQAIYSDIFCNSYNFILLESVIKTTSGGTPSRKNDDFYLQGTIDWVKSKELNAQFLIETEEQITELALSKSSAKLLPKHSLLIAMYGATVGEYCIISKNMTCNQAICALLPNQNYPFTYLFMFVKNNKEQIINLAVGSAQQNISQVLIKQLKVHAEIDLIQKFHKLVLPLFEQLENNIIENQKLSLLRDTLLPKLMSGEVRV